MFNKPPRYETNDQHQKAEKRHRILRRFGNVATGIGLTLITLLATDEALGAHTPTETKLVEEYPSYYDEDPSNADVTKDSMLMYELPGFNANATYVDSQLAHIVDKYGTRVKVVYGDDLSIDLLSSRIAEQIDAMAEDDSRSIVYYGHSVGGNTSIRIISELIEKYHVDPSRFALILDCSPASNDDVNTDIHQNFIDFLDLVSYTPLDGGPISRFTAESINALGDGLNPIEAVIRGWNNKSPEAQENSNAVVIAQAHILKDQQALIHAVYVLKENNVPVAFIGPGKSNDDTSYRNDGIVHNQTANADWKQRFGENLTDYLITEWNLHGIQKRNWNDYSNPIDTFLAAQGINPYQPDTIDTEDFGDFTFNADKEATLNDSPTDEESVVSPSTDPIEITPESTNYSISPSDQ